MIFNCSSINQIDGVVRSPQSNILHDLLSCVHFMSEHFRLVQNIQSSQNYYISSPPSAKLVVGSPSVHSRDDVTVPFNIGSGSIV